MSDFTQRLHAHFRAVSDAVLGELTTGEELTVNLEAEETLYVRFNENRVRQNTDVEQIVVSLRFQADGRSVAKSRTLTGDAGTDAANLRRLLQSCRDDAKQLPADPFQVAVRNNGSSRQDFTGGLLPAQAVIDAITGPAEGSDLAGLYCGGSVINANRNSSGQDHWFSTETFFMDYSLYDGPKAAKATYAGTHWNGDEWAAHVGRTREQLHLLGKPEQNIKPGKYRTYLAPGAVAEILTMFSWSALSASALKEGRCAFKKLAEGEVKLSPLFSLRENFGLGLSPRFNSLGEVAPETLSLIEKGELKEMLTSSRSAKEFGLKSNAASDWEAPRSAEVLPGTLSEKDILRELGTGLYLSNLHYLNWSDPVAARITGMTRYACFWVENGEIVGPIKDLRFDESLYDALGAKLLAVSAKAVIEPSVSTYGGHSLGGCKVPGVLVQDFTFTL